MCCFSKFSAASIQRAAVNWKEIDCPDTVQSWIEKGFPVPFTSEPEQFELENHKLSSKQESFVAQEIQALKASGAIQPVSYKPKCVSPLGCVPKKRNKLRLIVDLRRLNSHINVPSFQHENIKTVGSLIQKGDRLITLDLKDGFLHVPLHNESRDFLGIFFDGQYYVWNVCCFGLSISPYVFHKVLRVVNRHLRLRGLRLVIYVDDILLMSSEDSIDEHKSILLRCLSRLGWKINWEKSSLVPDTTKDYIGFTVSSCGPDGFPRIAIPTQRVRKLRKDIRRLLSRGYISARGLARVTGQCVSMAQAILPAKLMLRNAYRLLQSKSLWEDTLFIDNGTYADLEWWLDALTSWNGAPLVLRPIDVQMATDASHLGWGAVSGEAHAMGTWNKRVSHASSNYRELLAVLMGLWSFKDQLRGKHLQILSDNVVAVCYITCQGGSNPQLSQLATAIWALAVDLNVMLSARHLAGRDNVTADWLSRVGGRYEWRLHPRCFRWLDRRFGPHTIDRFASFLNTHIPIFNSRFADPMTSGVDAIAQRDWHRHNNFANPPFRLIPRILQTVQEQRAWVTLIAPYWPAQPWFAKLQALAVAPPVRLPNHAGIICRAVSDQEAEPLRNRAWRLHAWRIYGGNPFRH